MVVQKAGGEADALPGGDLYRITTVEPYPDDYASMLKRAQDELDADARPELAGELPNLENYDIIMIGYPIWHGATPRPVLTFLESDDLSGKKLVPFNTHEGSGQGRTVTEIAASAPNADTKFHLIHAHLRASFPPWLCFASVNDALHRLPPLSFARTKNPLRICTCFRRNLV